MRATRWMLLFLLCTRAAAAQLVDPFYELRMREGVDAYHRGDFVLAAESLRIANFGFLETPERLAEGLAMLALSYASTGNEEGFREAFLRIVDIEARFQAYSEVSMSADVRERFERIASKLVPRRTLESTPSFAHFVDRDIVELLDRLPPDKRKRELEGLIRNRPGEWRWRLILARLELNEGRDNQAIGRATDVLRVSPSNPEALLVRGLAYSRQREWEQSIQDLAASGKAGETPANARVLLSAYVQAERWSEAARFVASLSDEVRTSSVLRGLVAQVEQRAQRASPNGGPDSASALSDQDAEALITARSILAEALNPLALQDAFQLSRGVADRHPQVRRAQHLAGEAAYRLSRWQEAVTYFRRGGALPESEPRIAFYMAVSLFEVGEAHQAAEILRTCLPKLQRTPLVEDYAARILDQKGS